MKLNSILLIILFLFLISCSVTDTDFTQYKIVGQWEWVESTGGIGGHTISPDSTSYSKRQIKYSANQRFSLFHSDTLFLSGRYFLEKDDGITFVKYKIKGDKFYPAQTLRFDNNNKT